MPEIDTTRLPGAAFPPVGTVGLPGSDPDSASVLTKNWLSLPAKPVRSAEFVLPGLVAAVAALGTGGWFLADALPWLSGRVGAWSGLFFSALCLFAGLWVSGAVWRSRVVRSCGPTLWITPGGDCLAGEPLSLRPVRFVFGWRNASQARVRCQGADGHEFEWRVYRSGLSRTDWIRLCRWLLWQERGSRQSGRA